MALTLKQTQDLRRAGGWLCSLCLSASLLCLTDGLTAGFSGQGRILTGLPGMELPVTAPMPPETQDVDQLRILGQGETVRLVPEALYTGYWLGGAMWRGKVAIADTALPGEHEFRVEGPLLAPPPKPPIAIRVSVFATPKAMQAASPSFLTRHTALEPFPVSAVLFALALPLLLASYLLSQRVEALMTAAGQAVISLVKRDPEGDRIHFHLGRRNGLAPGDGLRVEDGRGREKGQAQVLDCEDQDGVAKMQEGSVLPGDIVSMKT